MPCSAQRRFGKKGQTFGSSDVEFQIFVFCVPCSDLGVCSYETGVREESELGKVNRFPPVLERAVIVFYTADPEAERSKQVP